MTVRPARLLWWGGLAVLLVAAVWLARAASALPTAESRSAAAAKIKCNFQTADVVCRRKRKLKISPAPGGHSGPRRAKVRAGSTVTVRGQGVSSVFLAREGRCDLLARGARTAIRTRAPNATFLFTQLRGTSVCTVGGTDNRVFVKGSTPTAGAAASSSQGRFSASFQESDEQGSPMQFRLRFHPTSSFGLAFRHGGAFVHLSTGDTLQVGDGEELVAGLSRSGAVKPGSVHIRDAQFTSADRHYLSQQAPAWFTLAVNADAGSGTGTVKSQPAGIACDPDCEEGYPTGTVVALFARAEAGSSFVGWGGDCANFLKVKRCLLTMDGDKVVTARFDVNVTR